MSEVYLPVVWGRAGVDGTPMGLGVGLPWQVGVPVATVLDGLGPRWWYDWRFEQLGTAGYVPMIWSAGVWAQQWTVLESLFRRRPEQFWLLWNEPERADQAHMDPATAAQLTATIAGHGVQYAAPGVCITTAQGYVWLERYLDAGGPVPDAWHVHIYHCLTPGQWDRAWAEWWAWMDKHGVKRPTLVTETNGWSEGEYGQRLLLTHVAEKMTREPLLLGVAWFAGTTFQWSAGKPFLLDEGGALTTVGETFARLAA